MAGTDFAALEEKKAELIRKALGGSVFLASVDAPQIETITDPTDSKLVPLPTSVGAKMPWGDAGLLSTDGAQFSRDVSTSDVNSWGRLTATRTDITADSTTLTFLCQETKLMTIGLATGVDTSAVVPLAGSGEVRINKPTRPTTRKYRVLSVAVDQSEAGEIYICRYLPKAKVSGFSDQAFGGGDDPIGWGVTMTSEVDDEVGLSESWIFGGPGWKAIVEEMGFPAVPTA